MTSLRFEGVACIRGQRLLLEGFDLALGPGEAALVTGPNGVGKSSLLRLAAGLLEPAAGTVTREGRIALADENAALDREQPLAKALLFWARLDGGGAADMGRGLAAMGLSHLAEMPVRLLSTGQRKRATLARVIAGGAQIWLLDEPGNGLDADSLALLEAAMAGHRASGGVVLAASHQPLGLEGARTIALASPPSVGDHDSRPHTRHPGLEPGPGSFADSPSAGRRWAPGQARGDGDGDNARGAEGS